MTDLVRLDALHMDEISGVDDPANQLPGWLVQKALDNGRKFIGAVVKDGRTQLLYGDGDESVQAVTDAMIAAGFDRDGVQALQRITEPTAKQVHNGARVPTLLDQLDTARKALADDWLFEHIVAHAIAKARHTNRHPGTGKFIVPNPEVREPGILFRAAKTAGEMLHPSPHGAGPKAPPSEAERLTQEAIDSAKIYSDSAKAKTLKGDILDAFRKHVPRPTVTAPTPAPEDEALLALAAELDAEPARKTVAADVAASLKLHDRTPESYMILKAARALSSAMGDELGTKIANLGWVIVGSDARSVTLGARGHEDVGRMTADVLKAIDDSSPWEVDRMDDEGVYVYLKRKKKS